MAEDVVKDLAGDQLVVNPTRDLAEDLTEDLANRLVEELLRRPSEGSGKDFAEELRKNRPGEDLVKDLTENC